MENVVWWCYQNREREKRRRRDDARFHKFQTIWKSRTWSIECRRSVLSGNWFWSLYARAACLINFCFSSFTISLFSFLFCFHSAVLCGSIPASIYTHSFQFLAGDVDNEFTSLFSPLFPHTTSSWPVFWTEFSWTIRPISGLVKRWFHTIYDRLSKTKNKKELKSDSKLCWLDEC